MSRLPDTVRFPVKVQLKLAGKLAAPENVKFVVGAVGRMVGEPLRIVAVGCHRLPTASIRLFAIVTGPTPPALPVVSVTFPFTCVAVLNSKPAALFSVRFWKRCCPGFGNAMLM